MKLSLKRKLAGALVVLLMFTTIMCDRTAILVSADNVITIAFPDGEVSGNTISYTVGTERVTITVSGGTVSGGDASGGSVLTVPENDLGSVTFALSNNFDSDKMQVKISATDGFSTTLAVTDYITSLAAKTNGNGGLPSTLNLVVEQSNNSGGDGDPVEESTPWTLDLRIGNAEYYDIQGNKSFLINSMEDVQEITVLRQKRGEEEWVDSIAELANLGLNGKSMSTICYDEEGRGTLEVFTIAKGENYITVNLQSHYLDSFGVIDIADFYVTNITFYVDEYVGISVEQQGPEPDMFGNLILSNQVDISGTTKEAPQTVLQYFANDTFQVGGVNNPGDVQQVELADGINPSAVTINGNTVTFNSNFYNEVTLKVTMQDGTVGYVQIQRLGLTIQSDGFRNEPHNFVYHGTQEGYNWSGTEYANKANIVGTFYYDSADTYEDYNVIATLTYADGRVETKEVTGIGETYCVDRSLKGGDYILYSGTKENAPIKVSASVVHSNAIEGTTFGGACFGNGAGVTYDVEK